MTPTIWIDIEDLLHYLAHHDRPSGIQRVVFEMGRSLHRLAPSQVRFVRRGHGPADFETVTWAQIEALFTRIARTSSKPEAAGSNGAGRVHDARATTVMAPVSEQLLPQLLKAQIGALRAASHLPASIAEEAFRYLRRLRSRQEHSQAQATQQSTPEEGPPAQTLADIAAPGDIFMALGSPWNRQDYPAIVRRLRDDLRMSFGLLMYDLVPIRHPEWCDRGLVRIFTEWHRLMLPLADKIFAISSATARDVEQLGVEQGMDLASPVIPVPMGTGFGTPGRPSRRPDHLPATGRYVLFVSTMEARKNHVLVFSVWRRLVDELGPDKVPTLVFAGKKGWMVSDLLQQLDNTHWLDGKIRLIENPSDDDLTHLYRGCLFTVFPSLFEGWGLPVTESLAMGRPCIASRSTSIPEAGGSLSRYFSPEDGEEALAVIRATILDPAGITAWQQQVARSFVPVSWDDAARRFLESWGIEVQPTTRGRF